MHPSADFLAQHRALTLGAGFARLDRTILTIRGQDRVTLLHSFCTNDIKQLQPGHGCEAFITSPQGKALGHVLVFCEPNELLLTTSAGQAETLIAHLNGFIISEDADLADRSSNIATILISGRAAASSIEQLAGAAVQLGMLESSIMRLGRADALLCRVPYTGSNCYFAHIPNEHSAALEQALLAAGATPCESNAVESARLEAGFPLFGSDITHENLPQEIGRDKQAISFQKGCYLGQETVARLDAIGHVNRRLVGVRFDAESVPPPSTPLLINDKSIGTITSSAYSPRLNAPLAFACLRAAHANAGTTLTSAVGHAIVISLPLQDS